MNYPQRAPYTSASIELAGQLQVVDLLVIEMRMATVPARDDDGQPPGWSVSGIRLANLMASAGTMDLVQDRNRRFLATVAVTWERVGGSGPLPEPGTGAWEEWLAGPAADATYLHVRRVLKTLAGSAGFDLELPGRPFGPVSHGIIPVAATAYPVDASEDSD